MQKTAPTLGRLLVMVAFALSCFGLILYLWIAFGGPIPFEPKGYRFKIVFEDAGQLADEADVRISGVPVGKVKVIEPGTGRNRGLTVATIELEERFAPLPSDSRAILRQKTLLGETYIELTPGTEGAEPIPEDGTMRQGNVEPAVELDEIFRALDEPTRISFRIWQQQLAAGVRGRGQDLNNALGLLDPFAQDTTRLLQVLNAQEGALQRLIRNTGVVFGALAERGDQLSSLIENSNGVFATTAARDQQLREIFQALPTFEREGRLTTRRITEFALNANPLVTQLRPAARELSPTLVQLGRLAPDLRDLLAAVPALVRASEAGLPALDRVLDDLRPVLGQLDPVLRNLNPPLHGLALYVRELTAFFANAAASTQAVDPNQPVHYLRTTNPINPEVLAVAQQRLGSNRPNPYQFPGAMARPPYNSYETRQCGRAVPLLAPQASLTPQQQALLPDLVRNLVDQFVYGGAGANVAAPPCNQQPPFPFLGYPPGTGQYPHVQADRAP